MIKYLSNKVNNGNDRSFIYYGQTFIAYFESHKGSIWTYVATMDGMFTISVASYQYTFTSYRRRSSEPSYPQFSRKNDISR